VTRAFLAEETGRNLPAYVAQRLRPDPVVGGQAVIRILFRGPHATDPVLSRLSRDAGTDLNILAGTVDEIAGQPYGTLVVGLSSGSIDTALAYLAARGLDAEVIGHLPAQTTHSDVVLDHVA
jgi:D-methionine transport system ATP-binding protein